MRKNDLPGASAICLHLDGDLKSRRVMIFPVRDRIRRLWVGMICSLGLLVTPGMVMGQQLKEGGWPVPDLKGLIPYSINIKMVDGVEKIIEKYYTPAGGHVARILGNGRVFAYVVDSDREPPIDYLLLDPDGSGKFTQKLGPHEPYLIPEWVSR
jgi:hypothetical protein